MTPPPAVTLSVPLVTVSVVVSALPSTSATDTPAIGSAVSSLTRLRARHRVDRRVVHRADGDGDGVDVLAVPSLVVTVSVSEPLKLRLPV